jgi:hypothetical protein
LATRIETWCEKQVRIDYKQTSSLLTSWKKTEELDFLYKFGCVPLQQCLRHLQKPFANFCGKELNILGLRKNVMAARLNLPNRLLRTGMLTCGWQSVKNHGIKFGRDF